MSNKPLYRSELSMHKGVQLLRIWDLCEESDRPVPTVTNCAEQVLSEIKAVLGTLPKLIIYKDSSGEWDRMLWSDQRQSVAFRPIAMNAPRDLGDDAAMNVAVKSFRHEFGIPNPIHMYQLHIQTLHNSGTKTLTYSCPACKQDLITRAAGEGEVWDTFATCPYCGKVYLKVTNGNSVNVRLP